MFQNVGSFSWGMYMHSNLDIDKMQSAILNVRAPTSHDLPSRFARFMIELRALQPYRLQHIDNRILWTSKQSTATHLQSLSRSSLKVSLEPGRTILQDARCSRHTIRTSFPWLSIIITATLIVERHRALCAAWTPCLCLGFGRRFLRRFDSLFNVRFDVCENVCQS